MQFSAAVASLIAAAATVSANQVTFWTLDDVKRTVYFTPSAGKEAIASIDVDNTKNTTVDFPIQWIGNWYARPTGAANVPGMLGEVTFNGWQDTTFYDVSAIVDPSDKNGVHQMFPIDELGPASGCEEFPCDHVYVLPDDVQTKTTKSNHLITTLGSGTTGLQLFH